MSRMQRKPAPHRVSGRTKTNLLKLMSELISLREKVAQAELTRLSRLDEGPKISFGINEDPRRAEKLRV
jgi:hypothetical protein